jgi:hypothetical protein
MMLQVSPRTRVALKLIAAAVLIAFILLFSTKDVDFVYTAF